MNLSRGGRPIDMERGERKKRGVLRREGIRRCYRRIMPHSQPPRYRPADPQRFWNLLTNNRECIP